MEFLIQNGDYVPDGKGGLKRLDGTQAVLGRVLFRLQARRGGLPFLPNLGSQLYRLTREKESARQALAQRYVAQALEEETDVTVKSVSVSQLASGQLEVTAYLEWQGEALTATAVV